MKIKAWLRYLAWIYDGRPDPSRGDPRAGLVVTGWGPIPLPGEGARLLRARDEATWLLSELDYHNVTEKLAAMCDWPAVIHDLSHREVIWDDVVAEKLNQGWRGATPEEIERIVAIVTTHMNP